MPTKYNLVRQSTILSIIVQFLTGLVLIPALMSGRGPRLLRDVLTMEAIVQLVEFVFYLYIVRTLNHTAGVRSMALKRYADWVLTTPTMLVALAAYFQHEHQTRDQMKDTDTFSSISDFWAVHRRRLGIMIGANALMLAAGAAGEFGVLSRPVATILGFLGYAVAFSVLFQYTQGERVNLTIFWTVASVWAVYGFVYLLPTQPKNVAYNGLDVVAKNFFGLYLSTKILSEASSTSVTYD